MRSVLVLETPHICHECQLHDGDRCILIGDVTDDDSVDLRCPLRPLPDRRIENGGYHDFGEAKENDGWNACLDAITGETE